MANIRDQIVSLTKSNYQLASEKEQETVWEITQRYCKKRRRRQAALNPQPYLLQAPNSTPALPCASAVESSADFSLTSCLHCRMNSSCSLLEADLQNGSGLYVRESHPAQEPPQSTWPAAFFQLFCDDLCDHTQKPCPLLESVFDRQLAQCLSDYLDLL